MADISEAMVEAACEAYWNAATIITAPWTSQPADQQHVVRVRMIAALEAVPALSAAPASAQMEGWRSVESAPKDGSRIQLLAVKLERMKLLPDILWIKIGSWRKHHLDGYEFAWREDAAAAPIDTGRARLAPTHWAPLPTSEGSSNG